MGGFCQKTDTKVLAQLELVEHEGDQQTRVDFALDDEMAAVEEHHGQNAHLQELKREG